MSRAEFLDFEFVEVIPEKLEDGRLYISIEYTTVVHMCACGCGTEVVTPLSPTDWKLIFDGETVSLDPSIGNWEFRCQSHYWVRRSRVVWAPGWSREKIEAGRMMDRRAKQEFFGEVTLPPSHFPEHPKPTNVWSRVWRWVRLRWPDKWLS